jgi:hypothetical protein
VKVTPKITIATGVILAIAVGVWASFDLRVQQRERRRSLEHEGKTVAIALRGIIESGGAVDEAQLSRVEAWQVAITPLDFGDPSLTPAQLRRLQAFADAPKLTVSTYEGGNYLFALPIRRPAPTIPDGIMVTGMIEVSRPTGFLEDQSRRDLIEALVLVVLVAGLATIAVGYLALNLMSPPVAKLLRGIDDVATGGLSRSEAHTSKRQ